MKKDKCYACLTLEAIVIVIGQAKSGVFGFCRNATDGCNDICPDLRQLYQTVSCKVCSDDKISVFIHAISV